MQQIGFQLNPRFIEELFEQLENQRRRGNDDFNARRKDELLPAREKELYERTPVDYELYERSTIPKVEHLVSLVETTFWASLQKEEGRALAFTLTYKETPAALDLERFDLIKPFAVEGLTKLAPIIVGDYSSLAIAPVNEQLQIVGWFPRFGTGFQIRILDPGHLIISYAASYIAIISGSSALIARDPFLAKKAISRSVFGIHDDEEIISRWDPSLDAILDVVREMRKLAHGGALIIVPKDDRWKKSVEEPIPFSKEELFTFATKDLKRLIEATEESGLYSGKLSAPLESMHVSCQHLAGLTNIDGATLINPNLEVIGFGAKLRSGPDASNPPNIFVHTPLDSPEIHLQTTIDRLGGMRHQSAARFIFNQRDAVAIVVSQDGNVTAFVWRDEYNERPSGLYAYRQLEASLF